MLPRVQSSPIKVGNSCNPTLLDPARPLNFTSERGLLVVVYVHNFLKHFLKALCQLTSARVLIGGEALKRHYALSRSAQ